MASMTGPLAGLKVADFSRQMAGPFATQVMADYGAEVLKVESLPRGDPSRVTGVDFIEGESSLFLLWNRGKRSLALNMRTDEGLDIARRLIAEADIMLENFRPGVADTIGIGYEAMSKINPRLIYCSISGFGQDGPMAKAPATDPIIQAMSGVMSVTGETDRERVLVGVPIADFTGALLAVQGAMFGIIARERTGKGQRVDVSMLYGLMSALNTRLASYWTTGKVPMPNGNAHTVVAPYQFFETSDGAAMAGVWGGDGWVRLCEAIGRPDLSDDPRFITNQDRMENLEALVSILKPIIAEKSNDEWQELFSGAGALYGPLLNFAELFEHPQVVHSGLLQSVEHASLGEIPQLGPVVGMSDTPGEIKGPPPVLGQHTVEVLTEMGFSEDEIQTLEASEVIRTTEI